MTRPQTPKMQIGELVALAFDGLAQLARHASVGISCRAESLRCRGSGRTTSLAMTPAPMIPASGSIQSQPKARASKRPTITRTDNGGVGHDVNYRRAHVVVAGCRAVRALVFLKRDWIIVLPDPHIGRESVRL